MKKLIRFCLATTFFWLCWALGALEWILEDDGDYLHYPTIFDRWWDWMTFQ